MADEQDLRPLYEPLDTTRLQIRLLTITSATDSNALNFSLRTVDLSDSPSYTALSYEWGIKENLQTIRVNNRLIQIRANLFDFLKTHRQLCDGRSLWVDQVCIDQGQLEEKNHQVGIMEHIYRGAEETLCWLGQDPADGLAFSFISRMLDYYRLRIRQGLKEPEYPDESDPWKCMSEAENNAFSAMATSSYWTRLWIVQEILLSAKVVVSYGSSTIPFTELVYACLGFQGMEHLRLLPDSPLKYIVLAADPRAKRHPRADFNVWVTASALAQETSCLDNRDKVFGIQSLFPPELRVHVDYSMTTESVWVDMIALWFKRCPDNNKNYFNAPSIFFASAMGLSLDKIRVVLGAKISASVKAQGTIDEEVDYQKILDQVEDEKYLHFWG
jgi:hypothetical protein